jgi:uncharacterized radical SAM superfamily Fe-S cluster-containing enzyme
MYTEILGSILQTGLKTRCAVCFDYVREDDFSLDCEFEEFRMTARELLKKKFGFVSRKFGFNLVGNFEKFLHES